MIYTIGHTESYEEYFKVRPFPMKLGKYDDYPGGSVWKTYPEALAQILHKCDGYSVYGVLADWDTDTEEIPGYCMRNLIRTSPLVRIGMTADGIVPLERILLTALENIHAFIEKEQCEPTMELEDALDECRFRAEEALRKAGRDLQQ